jgi:hypothetical protein
MGPIHDDTAQMLIHDDTAQVLIHAAPDVAGVQVVVATVVMVETGKHASSTYSTNNPRFHIQK